MIWVVWVGQSLRKVSKLILILQVNEVLTRTLKFSKGLDISRQVKNLKKATKLLSLLYMFRQKLLSSSVN